MQRILVIEDEPQVLANLREILQLSEFEVVTANNGRAGLLLAQQSPPDLIICDVMMPEMDGYTVLENLRQDSATALVPLIFLTARSERADMRRGMELGADDFLTKPFDPTELLKAIEGRLKKQNAINNHYQSELDRLQAQLDYVLHHDPLTQLPNWIALQEKFERLKQESSSIGLMVLHVPEMNVLLEQFGHSFVQVLLSAIAQRCSETPHFSTIGYLGSNQLALFLSELSNNSQQTEEDLRRALARPYQINNHTISLNPIMGTVLYPTHGQTFDALADHAETLISQALASPKTPTNGISPWDLKAAQSRRLEIELRKAIENNDLQLYYQPQVDLSTGRIIGGEALLRWLHADYGYISPAQFIPLAEQSGLIIELGIWVLQTTCQQISAWKHRGIDQITIAINLSAEQFKQPDLADQIETCLARHDLEPFRLDLELTESILVHDVEAASNLLKRLNNLGVRIAIDDFGTGYSSLSYLNQFIFNTLKIDQSFVRNIDANPGNQAIVKAILEMARGLGLNTIAEGVETARELQFLKHHGCCEMQGYLYSPPIVPEEFEKLLEAQSPDLAQISTV